MNVQIIASKFQKRGAKGDFNHMIQHDISLDEDPLTLYIYNDNCESYYSNNYRAGAGNAIIRQYNKFNPHVIRPFSAGIPTGSFENGGFDELNKEAIEVINGSIKIIEQIIKKYSIETLYYSTNDESGRLGKALFDVNNDVLDYITMKIKKLSVNKIVVEMNE